MLSVPWSLLVLAWTCVLGTSAQSWVSPCPSLFEYDAARAQGDTWHGDITLKTDQELSGIWMRVVLDRPPIEVSTDFGEVVQRESTEYLVRKPNHKLSPGETQRIRMTVKFNTLEPAPQLLGFRLNARVVCPESGILDKAGAAAAPPPAPAPSPNALESPCPESFNYEPLNETDRWFGVVTLRSDQRLDGAWIRITLDRESVQLGPGNTFPVRFFIKFKPGTPIPKVTELKLNGNTICRTEVFVVPVGVRPVITQQGGVIPPSSGVNFPNRPSASADNDGFFQPDFLPGRRPLGEVIDGVECGSVVAHPQPLITYGQRTEEGEWPWHAALYRAKGTDTKYICGGSLISRQHVITVAHCVARVYTNEPVDTDSLSVFLGKYFLTKYNSGIQYFQAARILIHHNYNFRNFRNDIAVIKLNHPVEFTDRVRPICLWSESRELNSIIGRDGTVVGWGFDQTGIVTESLFKTKMPVVNAQTCIYSYPEFFSRFTNEKTFCAGFRNFSSVCNGDSGGGMVFPKQDNPMRYHLRGLVSIGVALQSEAVCDTRHYAVFTDIAKYLDWITQTILI